jgi:hypothetical protein
MLIFWLFEERNKIKSILMKKKNIRFVFLFAILILVNVFFAISPVISFIKWVRVIEALFVSLYVVKTKPSVNTSIILLIISGVYSCVLGWAEFILQSSVGGIVWWIGERTFTPTTPGISRMIFDDRLFLRPYATFPHPNVLAGYITSLIPFLFFMKNVRSNTIRLIWIPLCVLFLMTIIISFSQIAWIISSIVLAFYLVTRASKYRRLIALVTGLIIIGILTISFAFIEKESVERRIVSATIAYEIIKQNPFTGVGLNNFILALPDFRHIATYQDLQPAHDIYLLLLSELGIVGIIIVSIIFFYIFNKIRIKHYVRSPFVHALCILLVFGLADHYIITIHQTLLFSSVLIGFSLSSPRGVIH